MKKLLSLSLIAAALLLHSCGGGNKEKTGEGDSTTVESGSGKVDLSGMVEHDLSGTGVKASIMVPEETGPSGAPFPVLDSVIIDGISWQISVGGKYNIILEEGDPAQAGKYVANEKKRLTETGIWDLKYEVDKPNLILYEANLKGGAGSKPFYHVFGVVKIEGKDFTIKSNEAGEFNKGQAEKMMKTIQALQK
jgi:hypothetical protein